MQLLSKTGISWTQTWVIMFLIPWTINEAMIELASMKRARTTPPPGPAWPGHMPTLEFPALAKANRLLDICDNFLATIALVFHIILLKTGPDNPLAPGETALIDFGGYLRPNLGPGPTYHSIPLLAIETSPVILLGFFGITSYSATKAHYFAGPLFASFIMLARISGNALAIGIDMLGTSQLTTYGGAFSPLIVYVFLVTVVFLGTHYVLVGENLLILYPDGPADRMKLDYMACFALAFFVATVASSALYYHRIPDLKH